VTIDYQGQLGLGVTPIEKLHVAGGTRTGAAPATLTLLDGGIKNSVTTITVDDTTGYPAAGTLLVDSEAMTYTGKTGTTFTGITRGALGTAAAAHSDNA